MNLDLVLRVRETGEVLGRLGAAAAAGQVSERLELRQRLLVQVGPRAPARPRPFEVADHPQQTVAKLPGLEARAAHDVLRLARIVGQAVQLGPRRIDELELAGVDGAQGRPVVVVERVVGLDVGGAFAGVQTQQERQQAAPALVREGRGRLGAERVENRRTEIDVTDRGLNPAAAESGFRQPHDQRHPSRAVVDEEAVEVLAVVAEPFPVVGCDHQKGPLEQASGLERLAQSSDQAVRVGDLRVVGPLRIARRERLGRLVGVVRLEQVQPQEERRARHLVEPGLGLPDRLRPPTLDGRQIQHARILDLELVVVAVEAPVDPPPPVQDEGADEASGAAARGGEILGQRRQPLVQRIADVLADTVNRGVDAGHDRAVRGESEGHRRHRVLEQDALAREPVEMRRLDLCVAVAAQTVGAQRIDRHQDDVPGLGGQVADGFGPGRNRGWPVGRFTGVGRCGAFRNRGRLPLAGEQRRDRKYRSHGTRPPAPQHDPLLCHIDHLQGAQYYENPS